MHRIACMDGRNPLFRLWRDLSCTILTPHMAAPPRPGVERFDTGSVDLRLSPITDGTDTPSAGFTAFTDVADMEVGVWDRTVGVSTHTEEDEIFVLLEGAVTVTESGHDPILFGRGDVGVLRAGAVTTWEVHRAVRKVWIARSEDGKGG